MRITDLEHVTPLHRCAHVLLTVGDASLRESDRVKELFFFFLYLAKQS